MRLRLCAVLCERCCRYIPCLRFIYDLLEWYLATVAKQQFYNVDTLLRESKVIFFVSCTLHSAWQITPMGPLSQSAQIRYLSHRVIRHVVPSTVYGTAVLSSISAGKSRDTPTLSKSHISFTRANSIMLLPPSVSSPPLRTSPLDPFDVPSSMSWNLSITSRGSSILCNKSRLIILHRQSSKEQTACTILTVCEPLYDTINSSTAATSTFCLFTFFVFLPFHTLTLSLSCCPKLNLNSGLAIETGLIDLLMYLIYTLY